MLKVLSITNFMAIEKLELEFTAPLTILAGQNEAGKSSVRDAILWLWTGVARGLKTHNDQSSLIREGAKFTEVSALLADGRGFTRRKTQKTAAQVMGDIPEIGLSPAILFDPYTFLSWPEDQRRELLFKVIPGLNPTEQNVFDRLIRWPAVEAITSNDGLPPSDIIRSIARMAASHGFPGAEKECVTKRRETKRVRDEYKGITEPVKILVIDGQEFDIPTLNLPAIEATLRDLQKEKDDLLRQKGAGEARGKRLERVQNQLQTLIIPPEPNLDEIVKLQKEIDDVKGQLKENAEQAAGCNVAEQFFPATCPVITIESMTCPKAGTRVGNTPPDPGVVEALTANRKGLVKKLTELDAAMISTRNLAMSHQAAVEKKASLESDLTDLQTEPEVGADLDTEIATRQRRIDRGQAFQTSVASYNIHLVRYQDTLAKLAAAEQEAIIYDALQKALAPDGIPSQMIAEALDGINELLEEAASYFFPGRYLHLTGELGIVLQNSPYITLSKSAKYRVGIAFQYALARLTGARILLIDEADILDDDRQDDLIKFLLAKVADFDQIMVFMTCTEPPDFVDDSGKMQFWWLENGQIISQDLRVDSGPLGDHPH
jgi:hypothetical protein